jgi:hypothetical protein
MPGLTDTDRIYQTSNAFATDAAWRKNKNTTTGKVTGLTPVSGSGLLGICGAMSAYWVKETFDGTAATSVSFPAHKLSIAQAYYLRYTNIDVDKAYYELIKIFGLKSNGFKNDTLSDCLAEMATKRNVRYVLQLNECTEHFTAVWNRGSDFLFFDPEEGCYRRGIGDYEDAIFEFLEAQYNADADEYVFADEVVME